jgi:hypothetical protein
VRWLLVLAACVAALAMTGCAKKSPTLAPVQGSEPQRLSFGDPQVVRKIFVDKMNVCWFGGPTPLLAGYRYDLTTAVLDDSGQKPMEQIIIRDAGRTSGLFLIQFNAFNDNTLISTRSEGFPPAITTRMKRDVETWIFEREGCSGAETADLKTGGGGAAAPAEPARFRFW